MHHDPVQQRDIRPGHTLQSMPCSQPSAMASTPCRTKAHAAGCRNRHLSRDAAAASPALRWPAGLSSVAQIALSRSCVAPCIARLCTPTPTLTPSSHPESSPPLRARNLASIMCSLRAKKQNGNDQLPCQIHSIKGRAALHCSHAANLLNCSLAQPEFPPYAPLIGLLLALCQLSFAPQVHYTLTCCSGWHFQRMSCHAPKEERLQAHPGGRFSRQVWRGSLGSRGRLRKCRHLGLVRGHWCFVGGKALLEVLLGRPQCLLSLRLSLPFLSLHANTERCH